MESTKTRIPAVFLTLVIVVLSASCGGGSGETDFETTNGTATTSKSGEERASKASEGSESGLTPAEATVGSQESSNMLPAGGGEPDPAQPPPENPPEDVKTYPATTNNLVEGAVDYERTPPTNGDHDPLWQNCGFYSEPVRDENAIHSLDHGAVWITYRSDLPQRQVDALRSYSDEEYVLVSPYPDQPAPVTVTAWRNQLRLEEAGDPRVEQFVEQFRISQTAPLSGNGCSGGAGNPA